MLEALQTRSLEKGKTMAEKGAFAYIVCLNKLVSANFKVWQEVVDI